MFNYLLRTNKCTARCNCNDYKVGNICSFVAFAEKQVYRKLASRCKHFTNDSLFRQSDGDN